MNLVTLVTLGKMGPPEKVMETQICLLLLFRKTFYASLYMTSFFFLFICLLYHSFTLDANLEPPKSLDALLREG